MKLKILVIGSTGLLGEKAFCSLSQNRRFKLFGTIHRNNLVVKSNNLNYFCLDIVDERQVLDVFERVRPDVVIHAASIGDVDFCQKNKRLAWKVNVDGVKNITKAASVFDSFLIFISSNAVYDGDHSPYKEESNRNPLNFYGKTKLEAEDYVRKRGVKWSILRFNTMYGWHNPYERSNPVTWIIDKLKSNEKINMVEDVYNNFLYVDNAAEAILKVIYLNKVGEIYNIAGRTSLNRYQLALKVAEAFELNQNLITSVKSDFFSYLAERPKNTTFDIGKSMSELGFNPLGIDEGLEQMKKASQSLLRDKILV